jgi:hypothetical protein
MVSNLVDSINIKDVKDYSAAKRFFESKEFRSLGFDIHSFS